MFSFYFLSTQRMRRNERENGKKNITKQIWNRGKVEFSFVPDKCKRGRENVENRLYHKWKKKIPSTETGNSKENSELQVKEKSSSMENKNFLM